MHDLGCPTLRLTFGGFLTGHGVQKLAGWFGGPGLEGFAGMLQSQGLRPRAAVGSARRRQRDRGRCADRSRAPPSPRPIVSMAPTAVAAGTVHRGKPVWAQARGAELALINFAFARPGARGAGRLLARPAAGHPPAPPAGRGVGRPDRRRRRGGDRPEPAVRDAAAGGGRRAAVLAGRRRRRRQARRPSRCSAGCSRPRAAAADLPGPGRARWGARPDVALRAAAGAVYPVAPHAPHGICPVPAHAAHTAISSPPPSPAGGTGTSPPPCTSHLRGRPRRRRR
jgi:putative oxidoreductase